MTTEQAAQLSQLATALDAAYQQVHAILLVIYDDDMQEVTDINTRVWISEAEMRLDNAAERIAQLVQEGATNG